MKFLGALLRSSDPNGLRTYLLQFSLHGSDPENSLHLFCPGCDIWIEKGSCEPLPDAPEGYYTGLSHLAFRRQNLTDAVQESIRNKISFGQGDRISFNPDVWGTGMEYVNPICAADLGMELCKRLDLPDTDTFCGVDHIGIPVADMAASVAFYRKLGFRPASDVHIFRAADRAEIHNVMAEGLGTVLELYEFRMPSHMPMRNTAFSALRFMADDNSELTAIGAQPVRPGYWSLTAPSGEHLEFFESSEKL